MGFGSFWVSYSGSRHYVDQTDYATEEEAKHALGFDLRAMLVFIDRLRSLGSVSGTAFLKLQCFTIPEPPLRRSDELRDGEEGDACAWN